MNINKFIAICIHFFISCSTIANDSDLHHFDLIKQAYSVPGMSVRVTQGGISTPMNTLANYNTGVMSTENSSNITSETLFPIASLTKVFASHTLISLVDEGMLGLDDSIKRWLPTANVSDDVTIKDLLTHTMINHDNKTFFYDPRFSWLTNIIEKASGVDYKTVLFNKLHRDFGKNALYPYLESHEQHKEVSGRLALGHKFEGKLVPIAHDYGLSASAGLVSTTKALTKIGIKLMESEFKKTTKTHVFNQIDDDNTYAFGFFRQYIQGQRILWSYGQYDGYASLWIIAPDKELQMIMLSNNNVLSDASRMIFGDIRTSPFLEIFMTEYLCKLQSCGTIEKYKVAELLKHVYLSRYNPEDYSAAKQILEKMSVLETDIKAYGELYLLHSISYLQEVSKRLGYEPLNIDALINALLSLPSEQNSHNPYWLYYIGVQYSQKDDFSAAADAFSKLIALDNMPRHWTKTEAEDILRKIGK